MVPELTHTTYTFSDYPFSTIDGLKTLEFMINLRMSNAFSKRLNSLIEKDKEFKILQKKERAVADSWKVLRRL